MKIDKLQVRTMVVLALILILVGVGSPDAGAQAPGQVLIRPFRIFSDKDLNFLQNGIQEMLSARLAVPGKIQPLEQELARQAQAAFPDTLNAETAAAMGRQFKADYVVYGSVTVFGESISTDAHFFNVAQGQDAVTFSRTGATPGDVIAHINLFAAQVNDEVFGRRQAEYQPAAPAQPETRSRMHPDRMWLEESAKMEQAFVADTRDGGRVPFTIWRSRSFSRTLVGLVVGDVDQDGQHECVLAGDQRVLVYRFVNQQFNRVTEYQGKPNEVILGVDAADVNANGKAEIFVTSRSNETQRLSSFVLEWDGRQLSRLPGSNNWYFRLVQDPLLGKVLLGQRRGTRTAFDDKIYEIKWNGHEYVQGDRRRVPRIIPSVFGLNYGDVLNNQQTATVGMDKNNYLQVYNAAGEIEWTSPDAMVGGTAYIEIPQGIYDNLPQQSQTRYPEDQIRRPRKFLPQRIHIADLDGNGRNEVYLANNDDASGRALPHTRVLRSGHVACLAWDQIGLVPLWKTREMPGYVADTAIADFDNDGEAELVMVVVTGTGMFSGKPRSSLYAWKPNVQPAQPQQSAQ